jgi:hypothetical protein
MANFFSEYPVLPRVGKLANPEDFQLNMAIWGLILMLNPVPKFCGILSDASRELAIL